MSNAKEEKLKRDKAPHRDFPRDKVRAYRKVIEDAGVRITQEKPLWNGQIRLFFDVDKFQRLSEAQASKSKKLEPARK